MSWYALRCFTIRENGSKKLRIKFCVKNKIKCTRPFEILTVAFGVSTMSRTQVQLCYNRFEEGREDVNDDARSGRSSTSAANEKTLIEAVKKMIVDG